VKLVCQREALQRAIRLAGNCVPRRQVHPAIDNRFRLQATSKVAIKATDYNIYVNYSLENYEVQVSEGGDCLLPLDRVTQLLKETRDEEISIEQEGNRCTFVLSDGQFVLFCEGAGEFPEAPSMKAKSSYRVSEKLLLEGIEKGRIARAHEEGRYLFDQVLLDIDPPTFSLVSTDGRRLARWRSELSSGNESGRVLVSPTVLDQVQRLIERSEREVEIQLGEGKVVFVTERAWISATTRDEASFPEYRGHLERSRNCIASLDRVAFLSASRRVCLLTTEHERAVLFRFEPGRLSLEVKSGSAGEGIVHLDCDYEGDSMEMTFDPLYFAEALHAMRESRVSIHFAEARDGAILQESDRFQYLVMPIVVEQPVGQGTRG
jgi:DNA polymerase-3 subunit beta